MHKYARKLTFLVLLAVSFCLMPVGADDFVHQRGDFHEAREALAQGDRVTFRALLPRLTDYPLYGYLLYDDLKMRINDASDSEIQAFLARYADLPVSALLRTVWLKRLAEGARWSDFLDNYRETPDTALRCLHAQALFATQSGGGTFSPSSQWIEDLRTWWFVGKSQPSECEDLFALWHQRGGFTTADLWQRVVLAFGAGHTDLAEQIGAWLPAEDRAWVSVWTRVHDNPQTGLNDPALAVNSTRARTIVQYGITRIAHKDIDTATERWERIKKRYAFTTEEQWETERSIALRAALDHHPLALELLTRLPFSDSEVRRARVRTALWEQNWSAVLRFVRALKPWEQTADRWRYWEARALEETHQSPAALSWARELYRELASHRSYHGFLAADRLGQTYAFNNQPLPHAEDDIARLAAQPAFVRAHELLLTGYLTDARREWTSATTGNTPTQLTVAAQLAAHWGWPDRVISTLGRTQEDDDLVLRFPVPYRDQVTAQAAAFGISPAVVYAVIRQESVFMADARSSVGALGLMQLMPATATQVARKLHVSFSGSSDLTSASGNIRLGSAFLAELIHHQKSVALAAAAYNAGPGRVNQWRPAHRMAADVWVESIPFDETRHYVRNVLTYAAIYGWRLQRSGVRLADGMPTVEPD